MTISWPLTVFVAINTLVLVWNLQIATRIVQSRRGTAAFRAVTALAGLLIVPGLLVAVAAASIPTGRAVWIVEWVWPATLFLCVVQAVLALVRHSEAPLLGLPFAAFNSVLLAAAVGRWITTIVHDPAPTVLAASGAQAGVLAFLLGREALFTPHALLVPILAPPFPAHLRAARGARSLLGLWTIVVIALFASEYPGAVYAAATYAPFGTDRLQARPDGDLAVGLRIFPRLSGAPSSTMVRDDLLLVDSLGGNVIALVIEPRAATRRTLGALAGMLEHRRRDSTLLVVALDYDPGDRKRLRDDESAFRRRRMAAVEEIAQRLRPEVFFPAHDPLTVGARALGEQPVRWWRAYLREAAAAVHRIRPATRVGVTVSAFTAPDSALYVWAAQPGSTIDVLGFSIQPSYGGGASIAARLRVAERLMQGGEKPHWIMARGAYPRLWGERNQERALWGMLAWSTRQPLVRGFVVDGAGDYESWTGLRAPGGRLRLAVDMLARARRALWEY
ncbi:MAG TPA: hypothetical protein VF178_11445 [Gemmatimonadaceae bacterium]